MLYKPRGYVCTRSCREGRTVFDLVTGVAGKLEPVGRLDKDSEGLLLMTGDGELLQRLTHPKYEHEKAYRVTVSGNVDAAVLSRLHGPVSDRGEVLGADRVRRLRAGDSGGRTVLEFVLHTGRRREVRRLCAAAGLGVHRLVRVRHGRLAVGGLKPGKWREVTAAELRALDGPRKDLRPGRATGTRGTDGRNHSAAADRPR
jgi:23S rRNA pseudouridine2605 synthase